MSIVSSILADLHNAQKVKWTEALRDAYENRNWTEIDKVITEIENFQWEE